MTSLRRAADLLIEAAAAIGALALLVEVAVILVDVVGRALGAPLFGSQDITTMAMVVLVFGPMALCDRLGGHVAVDLLEQRFPPALNRAIDIAVALLGAAIFLALAWAVWDSAVLSAMLNLSTNLLRLPKAWFQYALIAFSLIAALGLALRAAELAISGRDVRPREGGLPGDAERDPA